ncbi:30S ribosomal protein S8, partial [Candidatus Uhrbacteria bacterium]|nr:30S ribosomal protein S8 [Candidatus Uhrbacteria bacterium]
MHTHDPISDLLTRIRNAQAAKHDVTHVSHSNQKRAILDVMVKEGFIERVEQ